MSLGGPTLACHFVRNGSTISGHHWRTVLGAIGRPNFVSPIPSPETSPLESYDREAHDFQLWEGTSLPAMGRNKPPPASMNMVSSICFPLVPNFCTSFPFHWLIVSNNGFFNWICNNGRFYWNKPVYYRIMTLNTTKCRNRNKEWRILGRIIAA